MKRKKASKKEIIPSWIPEEVQEGIDKKIEEKKLDEKKPKGITIDNEGRLFMDRSLLRPGYNNHPDDWVDLANKLNDLEEFIRKWPGLTRFELARECSCDNDFEFRQAISLLKFASIIYEDDGFVYARNKYSL